MTVDYLSFAYASVVAAGGVVGYVKSGSVPSLAAGLLFGGVLGLGAWQTTRDPSNYYLSLGTSSVLAALMGYRFYNSGKFMPAGLVMALSLGMVARWTVVGVLGLVHSEGSKTPAVRKDL